MSVPRFFLPPSDRVTIAGLSYQPAGQNKKVVRLRRLDGSGVCSVFSYKQLIKLSQSSGWRYDRDWFADADAPIDNIHLPETSMSTMSPDEQDELAWKKVVFGAIDELHEGGRLARSHAGMKKARLELESLVTKRDTARQRPEVKPRGGAVASIHILPSNSTLLRLYRKYCKAGKSMVPFYPKGQQIRTPTRVDYESRELLRKHVLQYAAQERPTKKAIFELHKGVVQKKNRKRQKKGMPLLRAYSYSTICRQINDLDPFFVNCHRLGKDRARALVSSSSGGLTKLYPMQRIECDEWKVDVRSLMLRLGILDLLPSDIVARLPRTRRWICVVIDVATRVILGMRITEQPSAHDAVRALAMAVSDKNPIARAIGAQSTWHHYGGLGTVSCDTGPAFQSTAFQTAVTDFGGHLHFGPVRIPELRSTIERFFGTASKSLMPLLPGRTFHNSIERGDYDSDGRAVLDDETLLRIFIKWIVDYYHHAEHSGLNGQSPASRWKQLSKERWITHAPDRLTRRAAAGIEVPRTLTKDGIRLFNIFYTSETLQNHLIHSSQRKFRIRIDPDDIGGVAFLLDGKWHDAPARDDNFDGITLEAWKAEYAKIVQTHRAEAELNAELRAEALRSIRADVQSRLDQLLPGAEAVDAKSIEALEASLFTGKKWRSGSTDNLPVADDGLGAPIINEDDSDTTAPEDSEPENGHPHKPNTSGWEIEND